MTDSHRVFDAHFHIIDGRFPLMPNNGYVPEPFTCTDYRQRMSGYALAGGAVVAGSFQGFDQTWLPDALARLGPPFAGIAQIEPSISDERIFELDRAGVRGIRFNLKRGGAEQIGYLTSLAQRVYELVRWHVELYADARDLASLQDTITALPQASIDHLGLSRDGFGTLLKLAEKGVHVKASGFGRVDFDVQQALRDLYSANPDALMFGTDLPSTRAPRAYRDSDFSLIVDSFDAGAADKILYENAARFYRVGRAAGLPEARS